MSSPNPLQNNALLVEALSPADGTRVAFSCGGEGTVFRLTEDITNGVAPVIRLEGRLEVATAQLLRDHVGGRIVGLDISGLTGLDGVGRELLLGLVGRGCQLAGGSVYIRRVIEEGAL